MTSFFKFTSKDLDEVPLASEKFSEIPSKKGFFSYKKPEEVFESTSKEWTEEDLQREIERSQARTLSRVGETILGFPGNVQQFLKSMLPEGLQGLGGISIPGSSDLQKFSEEMTGGYTKAQSQMEEKTDEFMKDVAGMMIPGGAGYSLSRNIGIPLAGSLIKELSPDEKKGEYAKMGTMFLLDLINAKRGQIAAGGIRGLGSAQRYAQGLFRQAEASLPHGPHYIDVRNMISELNHLERELMRGGGSPSSNAALERINALRQRAQNGYMDVHELMPARTAINEIQDQLGAFNFEVPRSIRRRSIRNLDRVKRAVINAGEDYGRQMNPEFLGYWRDANEAYRVVNQTNVATNFIQKILGKYALNPLTKTAFGLTGIGTSVFKPSLGLLGGGGFGLYQAAKTLARITQSPVLARFYERAMRGAIHGQQESLVRNALKFNEEAKKQEKERKKKISKLFED